MGRAPAVQRSLSSAVGPELPSTTHSDRRVLAYLNGSFLPRSAATISVEDRGFIFGDGIYEVWRVVNGRLFETDRHLARLLHGLGELRIRSSDVLEGSRLLGVAERLLSESGLTEGEATFYVEVTRGAAPRAHQFPSTATAPTVYMTVNRLTPANDLRERGAAGITIPDVRWLRCDIKSIQLLPNVLAKQAAVERGAVDALMVRDGMVTEGSHSNFIGVVDGVLRTHPRNHLILPGITRAVVLEIAAGLGISVVEEPVAEAEIDRLDEAFLTGTTTDVMPIVRVNDRPIRSGKPGPITVRLATEFRAHLDAACGAAHATS
jgi:D-alanine transaminase